MTIPYCGVASLGNGNEGTFQGPELKEWGSLVPWTVSDMGLCTTYQEEVTVMLGM